MKTKDEILAPIAADPAQALRDIETLKTQLIGDRMMTEQKEKLCCLFNQQAIDYCHKYHFCRTRLIRARILVRELKKIRAAQK